MIKKEIENNKNLMPYYKEYINSKEKYIILAGSCRGEENILKKGVKS